MKQLRSHCDHSRREFVTRVKSQLRSLPTRTFKNFLLKNSHIEVMSLNFSKLNFGTLKSRWSLSSNICYAYKESLEVTSNQEVKNSHIEVMSLNFCETTSKSQWFHSSIICYAREESIEVTSNQEVKNFLLKNSHIEVMSLNFLKLNFGNFEVTVVTLVENLLRA